MKRIFSLILLMCWAFNIHNLSAQCTPASADNCEDANVLCSLNEVNGYTCKNTDYSNPTGCSPLCPGGYSAQNTGWWAFVTNGGLVCITLTFSNCSVNGTGIQFGIWGDCDCGESVFCDGTCTGSSGSKQACGTLDACKTYYLFVDGCSGDVCDFTLTTSGGSAPMLPPLGNLVGPTTLCKGACNVKYSISVGNGSCLPAYQWTLDGVELDQYTKEITLDFPDEGDFVLCVTAIIGNPQSGSICDQEGPKCITIKVRQEKDRRAGPRFICFENAPFNWQGQSVGSSGEYMQHFTDKNCCEYDSIVTFVLLDKPEPPNVYFIGCPGDVYKDPTTGKQYSACQNATEVILIESTNPHKCDSSYNLTAAFISGTGRMREYCQGGMILCEVTPIDRTCPVNGYYTESFLYHWYRKSDPGKKLLGTDEYLELTDKDEYCCDMTFVGKLDNLTKNCVFTICEQFNEDDFKFKQICPKGDLQLCVGKTGTYSVDTIFPADARHIWTVSGGIILTQNPIANKTIEVLWNFDPKPAKEYDGIICYQMQSSCPETPECCITIKIKVAPQPSAGPDISLCGLDTKLRGTFDVGGGTWVQISGPPATITPNNVSDPDISSSGYGRGVFVLTENSLGCVTSDSVVVNFNETPEKGPVSYICAGNNKEFTIIFDVSKGTPPYKVLKGNGTISSSNVYTSGIIPNLKSDTVTIEDMNGCQFTFIHDYECKCTNDIGEMTRSLQERCADGTIDISKIYDSSKEILDITPRDTAIFFFYDATGKVLGNVKSKTIQYDPNWMQFGVEYYIGVKLGRANGNGDINALLGCLREDRGTPFVFYEIPRPQAGLDLSICSATYDLLGVQSISGTKITWREKNGKAVSFSNSGDPNSVVDILDGFGTYCFIMEEDNHNGLCVQEDEVCITFNPNPELINVNKYCTRDVGGLGSDDRYLVKIDITTGKPAYTLVIPPSTANGTIIGNQYVSDTLASLEDFIVVVRDANGCESQLLLDNYNCNCGPINAGLLDTNVIRVCEDKCVPITSLIPETIDPKEDIAMFVLHTSYGNFLDPNGVLDSFYNLSDVICFNPATMKTGSVNSIYLTRIVGDDLSPRDGVVDFKDPCKRNSKPMQIIFEPYATPIAGPDNKICGLNYTLDGQLTFGNASWRFLSGPGTVTFVDAADPQSGLTVSIIGTYSFELQGDNFGCLGLDTVRVTFVDSPEFVDNSITYVCDNVAENYKITINSIKGDRPSWDLTGKYDNGNNVLNGQYINNGTVWESGWIPTGNNFDLSIKDVNDCATDLYSGSHICACITDAGNMDLTPINLCVDGCAQAKYTVAPGMMDANDVIRYVLYDGVSNNPRNGAQLNFNDNGRFCFDATKMTLGKTYYVAVFVGNVDPSTGNILFTDRCLDNTPGVPITWFSYPIAKIDGPNLLTCKVTSIVLNAGNSVSGSGDALQYTWSTGSPTSTITITTPGTYTVSIIDPRAGCPGSVSFVVTQDVQKPAVAIDNPLELTCARTSVNLDGNKSDKGAIYTATWSTTNGTITGGSSTYLATVSSVGDYVLTVENTFNGCLDSKIIRVTEDKALPLADIKQIGDLTCTINQIQLDGSGSRGNSGTIGSYTWVGSIITGQGTPNVTIGKPGGSFILEVRDSKNGCLSRDTIRVTEIGNPLVDILSTPANPKCFGDRNGQIVVGDVLDINGNPLSNLTYSLNGGPYTSNRTFTNLPQGSYTISVKDANGCLLAEKEQLVEPGKLGIEVIRSIVVDQGDVVNLDSLLLRLYGGTANNNGAYKDTTWFNLDDQVYYNNLSYVADTTREFLITGIDQSGCEISDRVRILVRVIKEVWWPNVMNPGSFQPDNSHFNLYGKRVRSIKLLQIYDRWGELVYSGENLQDGNKVKGLGWNGEFRGEKSLPGVYAFYAEVQYEGSVGTDKFKGDFTLLR